MLRLERSADDTLAQWIKAGRAIVQPWPNIDPALHTHVRPERLVQIALPSRVGDVTVAADHEIAIRLPDDFPSGPAEIIVLGKIVLHEDPSLPLDPEDWPES